jgi:hypothetical protein
LFTHESMDFSSNFSSANGAKRTAENRIAADRHLIDLIQTSCKW